MNIEKESLIKQAIIRLESELRALENGIKNEKQTIKEAPTARQSWSDTTRSQGETLVNALQNQCKQTIDNLAALKGISLNNRDRIEAGAIVELKNDRGNQDIYLITSGVGGSFRLDGKEVIFISSDAPIAKALFGHKRGDIIKVETPAGVQVFEILNVT